MNTTAAIPETGESVTLYYKEGPSDKVYQASLEPAGERWVVNFAFGRRGSTMNTGTKTNVPVEYDKAKTIYDKLVREKTAKGYTPGENGAPYQHSDKEARNTGILPQLLNPIEQAESLILMRDMDHWMQEKFDGKRVLLWKHGDKITGINRKGLSIGLPVPILQCAEQLPGDWIIDGECVGETFHAFDLLESGGDNLRPQPYCVRYQLLTLKPLRPGPLCLAETASAPVQKERMLERLLRLKREGVVFKHIDAPYRPGRPASGGPQLKHKFYATLSAQVAARNLKRSVEIRLSGPNGWQTAGNVTIPPDRPIPPVLSIIEIRYLYAFRESGCLFQPTFLGVRGDLDATACVTAQLKFKSSDEEES